MTCKGQLISKANSKLLPLICWFYVLCRNGSKMILDRANHSGWVPIVLEGFNSNSLWSGPKYKKLSIKVYFEPDQNDLYPTKIICTTVPLGDWLERKKFQLAIAMTITCSWHQKNETRNSKCCKMSFKAFIMKKERSKLFLMSLVSHKKSYLVCVKLTNFWIFTQAIPIFFIVQNWDSCLKK
jgi:hypothetical protein